MELPQIEQTFDGASLLGLELDGSYRVLAATIEPEPDHLDAMYAQAVELGVEQAPPGDRRLQVLISPVALIIATLISTEGGTQEILTFELEQLLDVSTALGGAVITSTAFDAPEAQYRVDNPVTSLEGASNAPDGRTNTIRMDARDDQLRLDVFVRFDNIELRSPTGTLLVAVTD